jgi:hypothetical protein
MTIINKNLVRDGFYIIKNALKLDENIEELFDNASEKIIGKSLKTYDENGPTPNVTMGLERSIELCNSMIGAGILNIINDVFGEDIRFWGSDLSTFKNNSQWHRDLAFEMPVYKVATYLEGSYGKDQQFLLIPGSHHVTDRYAHELALDCNWPNGGGLNIEGFNHLYDKLENKKYYNVNAISIQIERGDVIIFDQRIIHTALGNKLRRLISTSLFPSFKLLPQVWSNKNNMPLNEVDFSSWLFKIKCAIRILEKNRLKNYISSHYNLEFLETKFKNYVYFDRWTEEDFDYGVQKLFRNSKNEEIVNLINPYGRSHV